MNSNNCSSNNLIALASSLAVVIGNEYDTNELSILAAYFTAFGDNHALIDATR